MTETTNRNSWLIRSICVSAGLVLGLGIAFLGCEASVPDTAPAFTRTVADQRYTAGEAIRPLVLPEAVGGNGALSYELTPAVPGLTFDGGTRTLSGTPSTANRYAMTYRVTDADDNTTASDADTRSFTIAVREGDTAPAFTRTVADQSYTAGEAIRPLVLPEAVGGNGALSYELTPAVPGLTFDGGTRTLSGTPSTANRYAMTYRVTDADDNTTASDADTRRFTIAVREGDTAPAFTRTVADQSYTAGEAIRPLVLPEAVGGNGALSYELTPAVPGLTFDGGTRTLSGTPSTANSYAMTYRVTDADGNTADSDADTRSFTIAVREGDTAPAFTRTVADQRYTSGEAIRPLVLPEAVGGNGALSYELTPAVPGLTFDGGTRTLSGTPSTANRYTMTYRVTDADDNTTASDADTRRFTIAVREGDTAPAFTRTVADQRYTAGEAIRPLVLPEAVGGNGALSYELTPAVPGLTFDGGTRTLSGTPSTANRYTMTYRVTDADGNTADSDADTLTFTITVGPAFVVSCTYRGSGDEVCPVNGDGRALDQMSYELRLGAARPEVYLIATNTNSHSASARVQRLDAAVATEGQGPFAGIEYPSQRLRTDSSGHTPPWIVEFNNSPPRLERSGAPQRNRSQALGAVAEGDRFTFISVWRGTTAAVPATARRVVSDGSTTFAVWVADREWSATCQAVHQCMTQEMVDALAGRFLRPGDSNDIYDWVTAIFGAPWGPHDNSYLIPAESASQIHVVFFDIEGDSIPARGQGRFYGYFHGLNNHLRADDSDWLRGSNERLMFFMDAPLMAHREGPTWDLTDRWPDTLISGLAHEFQHMIHYYQKIILRGGVSETWLNEMASEVTQDLVADKIESDGPRGVSYGDPTAGEAGNRRGRLGRYNYYNHIQVTAWDREESWKNYSINYALGAYLARTYGGAGLFGDIVASGQSGVDAIERALRTHGHHDSFGDVLQNWGVANLLSDNSRGSVPYRYNSGGTWSTSRAGGETYRLGSIDLYNHRYHYGSGPSDYLDGPRLYRFQQFSDGIRRDPHSNAYTTLGRMTGTARLRISASAGLRITLVVKE